MFGTVGNRSVARLLVAIQVFLLVASFFAPVASLAAEPSDDPGATPSAEPSAEPTPEPTAEPTPEPTPEPTAEPTPEPTAEPTPEPTAEPTPEPAVEPTPDPTPDPTAAPTAPPAPTYAPSGPPSIRSDLDDYPPGGFVTLTGSNWHAGEGVHIFVNDHVGTSWSRTVDVIADGDGNIRDAFNLPNWFVADYSVIATGAASGVATAAFTDSNPSSIAVAAPTSKTVFAGETTSYGTVTVSAGGNTNPCNTTLSIAPPAGPVTGLPAGVTATFGTNPVQTASNSATSTLNVTTSGSTAPGTYTFQVRGIDSVPATGGACEGQANTGPSNTLTLIVSSNTSTTTVASNATATYGDTSVTLTATVTPATVGVGTVTFTIKSGSTTIGSVTSGTVAAGAASASFSLDGVNAATYTIEAAYSGGTGFNASNNAAQDPDPTLTINKKVLSVNAVANSKTYGNADPAFGWTYSGFITGENSGNVTIAGSASCTRTAGETVGGSPYAITCAPGTLSATNYSFETGATADFTINLRPATWTTNPNSKTYGNADPSPLTTGSGSGFLAADGVSATYSRAAGESVAGSPYHITATLSSTAAGALANYSITNDGAAFTINLRPATWTTNPNSKTYGNADPSPLTTGSGSGFLAADGVSATYSRAAGESVAGSPYHITATLSSTAAGALANYSITNDGAAFTINLRPATWTTNPNSKTYGNADPSPLTTGSGSGFLAADGVSATYSRAAGESVAGSPYHITATLSSTAAGALANYFITNDGAAFTINLRPATWTTNPNSKTYGNADPSPLTTGSGSGFLAADGVSATYSRAAGESVAGSPYHITATLSSTAAGALANYSITNAGAAFTINLRPATWTTNPNSKTYGNADPSPLTTGSGSGFLAADGVSATYSRAAGESVAGSPYHITATLSSTAAGALANYSITNAGAAFTIDKKALAVNAVADSKTYGDLDPAFGWTYSGFITGEDETNVTITGDADCTRTAGETVAGSPYTITCAPGDLEADNYSFVTGTTAAFTIDKKALAVNAVADSKTYGDLDPAFGWTYSGFITGEDETNVTITGDADCTRTAGETLAGSPYTITCAPGDLEADNYSFVTGTTAAFTIDKKALAVNAVADSKTYGDLDPAFGWTYSGFITGEDETNVTITGDADCTRTAGETVAGSPYTITCAPGDLEADNYSFVTGTTAAFTIDKKALAVNAVADSKTYGDLDPAFGWTYSGFITGEDETNVTITGDADCTRTAGETVAGSPYTITCAPGDLEADNYSFVTGTTAAFTIDKKALAVNAVADSKTYGDLDPAFGWTYSGFITGEDETNVTITGDADCTRTAGETVAGSPYTITCAPGDLEADNYSFVTGTTAAFTIDKRLATWTTNDASKTYGEADPSPLTSGSGSNFLAADGVTATYSRATGETVAGSPYHITATLSSTVVDALDNYIITNDGAAFTIDRAVLSVSAIANAKTYGDADPALGYTLSGFKFGQNATSAGVSGNAMCARAVGQSVAGSPYTITCAPGTLAAANYSFVTGATANFTINRRPATWTTQNNSKILGSLDPVPLTTGSGSNFLAADGVSATYTRVPGETVGSYAITATLSSTAAGALNNYTITNAGATFKILFDWDGFLQPINDTAHQTGTAQSKFKLGQTIPAKFVIKDAAGNVVQQAILPTFSRSNNLGPCDTTTSPEALPALAPDAGTVYNWQGGQYHYNWSTKGLTAGEYRIYANLADGTARYVDICLTK